MTPATLNLQLLAAAVKAIPADDLSAIRSNAAESFARTNFPTQKDEDWKYTNLSAAADLSNAWLTESTDSEQMVPSLESQDSAISELKSDIDAHWLVIRNGEIDAASFEDLSSRIGGDVAISRLSDGVADGEIHIDDPLSAFNAALLHDGLSVNVGVDAQLTKPLGILYFDDGTARLSQSRLIINCARDSRIGVVECALSAGDAQFANHVGQVDLAAGAQLDYVRIQQRDHAHHGINRLSATVGENAILNHSAFDFGNAVSRNDVVVRISGAGADANLHGLYLADQQQHIDNHLSVIHDVGPATSLQNYRGILTGRSRCVFNGKAKVMHGADGTDANQANHNLLLSDKAEIDTKPELEIYADDVKCSHGATVGQLDEASIFYLRSRGLSLSDARQVLTRAFATQILTDLSLEECRTYVSAALERRLARLIESDNSAGIEQ